MGSGAGFKIVVSTHCGIKALKKIDDLAGLPAMSEGDWRTLRENCEAEFRNNKKSGAEEKKSGKAPSDD